MNHTLMGAVAIVVFLALSLAVIGAAQPEPQATAVIADGARVEKLAGGMRFTEGPVWDPRGFLIFSDIPANTLHKWSPEGGLEVFRRPSGHANGNTLDREGRLITCEHDGRVSRTEPDGRVVTLVDRFEGKRLNSPNDLAVHSDGSIYFTDPPYGTTREREELGFYGVYRLAPDGRLTLLTREMRRPNGLAFSPDERRLYVGDSQENVLRVFDVRPDGTLGPGRVFADLRSPGVDGAADGMKVDRRGNVYTTGPGGVWVLDPTGRLLGKIVVPEVPANLCFGDADRRTLYMTARTGLYRVRVRHPGVALPGQGPARRRAR
ncbi:MAG TPA: SMP-30/gluconolactonase/LRE family protein [Chthonomonadales bacterium]|nr:SMP-30/gluconolactonase/LRE family protein [Chthonomonadales bacterium]